MALLQPGRYLIELESRRPVDFKALGRVLGAMGFSRAVPDQMPNQGDEIGAVPLPSAARASSTTTKPASTMRLSSYMMQPGTTAPAAAKPPAPPKAPAPSTATTTATSTVNKMTYASSSPVQATKRVANTTQQEAIWASQQLPGYKPAPTAPPVARPVVTNKNPLVRAPEPPKKKQQGAFDWGPGGPPPPGGGVDQAPPGDQGTVHDPGSPETSPEDPGGYEYGSPDLGPAPPSEGWMPGGGGGGGGEGFRPPAGEYVSSADDGSERGSLIFSLWQAWRDYGTPFGGASTSGEAGEPRRVRFIGELQTPLHTQDTSEIRWISAVPISVDPFEKLSLILRPYQLRSGKTYEIRFLSRSKSGPSRADVEKMLAEMGWRVHRLSAIKNNMRLPGRSGANLVLWFGVGDWMKPDSVVVTDDPFYFEDVLEVA